MTDQSYDEWVAALGTDAAFYLECPEGHGSLPPRRTCPHCGATELSETPLPETGTVETYTEVHVAGPDFAGQTPYVTAIASFGDVRLTGVLRGVSAEEVEAGRSVSVETAENPDTGKALVAFRPW